MAAIEPCRLLFSLLLPLIPLLVVVAAVLVYLGSVLEVGFVCNIVPGICPK